MNNLKQFNFNSNSPIGLEIFNFVINNSINPDKYSDSFQKSLIEKFISEKSQNINGSEEDKKKIVLEDLTELSFLELSSYTRNNISDSDLIWYVLLFSHIKSKIFQKSFSLEYEEKCKENRKWKLERQISPPLSAYQYEGNNFLDIKYSNKSYGLLFD